MQKLLVFLTIFLATEIALGVKIQPDLSQHLSIHQNANVFLSFYRDPTQIPRISKSFQGQSLTRGDKISLIKSSLEEEASLRQERVVKYLSKNRSEASFSSLWITNQIYIRDLNQVELNKLLEFEEILNISLERVYNFGDFEKSQVTRVKVNATAEWGVDKIEAEAALQLLRNVTGNNFPEIRIGVMSTGAHATHTVLKDSFLGSYGWYDPYGSVTAPIDEVGVGSHETGVIAGSQGVGVFPSGKWMSCRACEFFGCEEFAIFKCAEFLTCPYLLNDTLPNPDCSRAPHIVHGDIWTLAGDTWFDSTLEIWEAAGIIPIWPIGGSGPLCSTARYPSESSKVIAVGGTTPLDIWYERSSAGPPLFNPRAIKPDMVAPSTNIMSAFNLDDTTLQPLSATSCASAHIAGVVGILKAYDPNLTFTQILIALARGAERDRLDFGLDEDSECGSIPVTKFPNNVFGYGRVNALESLKYVIQH